MPKSNIGFDLRMAIDGLKPFAPYSTSPQAGQWHRCSEILHDIEAVIRLIDARKPGLLNSLEEHLLDETQLEEFGEHPQILALIDRHCHFREPMR